MGKRSVSQFLTYQDCPERWRLEKQVGVPQHPAVWSPAGSAMHYVTEVWERDRLGGTGKSRSDYLEVFQVDFDARLQAEVDASGIPLAQFRTTNKTADQPGGLDREWWLKSSGDLLDRYTSWREETGWEIAISKDGEPGIEYEFIVKVPEELDDRPEVTLVRGAIDRVFTGLPGFGVVAYDLKYGSKQGDLLQLGTYAAVWETVSDQPVNAGGWFMGRKEGNSGPYHLGAVKEWRNINAAYRRLDLAIIDGVFVPRFGTNCQRCFVKEHCSFAQVERSTLA